MADHRFAFGIGLGGAGLLFLVGIVLILIVDWGPNGPYRPYEIPAFAFMAVAAGVVLAITGAALLGPDA